MAETFNVSVSTIKRFIKKYNLTSRKIIVDKEAILNLYNQGFNDATIAKHMGIAKCTVSKIRNSLKLPSIENKAKQTDIEQFKKLYDLGLNDSEIGKILNKNHVTIKNWRESMNLSTNFQYSRKFDTLKFMELYNEGKNYTEIARILNVSNSTISDYAKSLNLTNNLINKINPSYEEEQIILGTLLGDGCLIKQSINASLNFAHSLSQENYCKWKQSKLSRFGNYSNYKTEYDSRTGKNYSCYYAYFGVAKYFTNIYSLVYKTVNGVKTKYINKDLLYKVDALGLAIWFMDDGYKDSCSYCISTNCFSNEDLEIIQQYFLDKFNIKTSKKSSNVLYIKAESRDTFTALIEPYIHKDCEYKLHGRIKTPLNEEHPKEDNLVLKLQEIEKMSND